jgi:hypothetical protein
VDSYLDYPSFCEAVRKINPTYIKESAERLEREREEKKRNEEEIARLKKEVANLAKLQESPTRGIGNQLTSMSFRTPPPSPTARYGGRRNDLFNQAPIGGGGAYRGTSRAFPSTLPQSVSPSRGSQQPVAISNEESVRLKGLIDGITVLPNTREGIAQYEAAKDEWVRKYPDGRVKIDRLFPLRPGSSLPCCGECFDCGKTGHSGGTCDPLMATDPRETVYRRLCQAAFGAYKRVRTPRFGQPFLPRGPPQPVRYFEPGDEEPMSGNGDGL